MSETKETLENLTRSATEEELEVAVNELTEQELDDLVEALDTEEKESETEEVSEEVERALEVMPEQQESTSNENPDTYKADLFDEVPSLPSRQPKMARKEMLRSMREKMAVACSELDDSELEAVYEHWMLPDWCMMPSRASTVANTTATQKESLQDPAYNAEKFNKKSKVIQSPVLTETMTPDVSKQKLDDNYQMQQLSSDMESENVEEVEFPKVKISTPNSKVVNPNRSEEEQENEETKEEDVERSVNNENLTKVIEDNTQNNQSEENSEMDMEALKEILRSAVQEAVNPLNEKMDALKEENDKLKAELEVVRNQPATSPINLVNNNASSGDPAKANHEVVRSKFEQLIKEQNPNAAVALLMASGLRNEMRKRNKEND